MKFTILSLIILIMFTGCDRKSPPPYIDPDTIYDEIPIYNAATSKAPYSVNKFKSVIKQCKLQILHDDVVDYDDFEGKKFKQFYVDKNDYLHFKVEKKANTLKVRSELREGPNSWSTADTDGHFWVGTLKCLKPKPGITSYTWMQIHGTSDSFNYPILRLLWERKRVGIYDHIWAVIIVSDPDTPKIYEYVDLGPRPNGFFTAEVHIRNNIMDILINHNLKSTRNVTYWESVNNYFKAGVYIDRYGNGGAVSAIFKNLHFYDDPSKVVSAHH